MTELEKEADEYAKKDCPDNFLCTRSIAKRSYLAGAKPRDKQIASLEAKLTKAKEIIKVMLNTLPKENTKDIYEWFIEQAEQFLEGE